MRGKLLLSMLLSLAFISLTAFMKNDNSVKSAESGRLCFDTNDDAGADSFLLASSRQKKNTGGSKSDKSERSSGDDSSMDESSASSGKRGLVSSWERKRKNSNDDSKSSESSSDKKDNGGEDGNKGGTREDEKKRDPDSKDYIISDSDSELISRDSLKKLSDEDLRLAINEIYARHGRKFKSRELQDYFDSKDWYTPRYEPEEFDKKQNSLLNEIELKNLKTMTAERDSRK
ncbi:MAG: YARHG domain-containing protein [Lachnospiraceae bacterium]|nr:YARHG domain-containing protein [Lachnospiraceae bacterium]